MGAAARLKVAVRKQSMVPPSEPTPERILWNSNVDLVIPRIHTQSVYFYEDDGSADFFDHEKLVEALGKTLVPFYPMAGRLRRGEEGRIEINCNAEGVLLVEAVADAVVAEFGVFAPDPRFRQLVPQVDYEKDISSFPLLVLQITFFKCGGVSLGVGMQHHVADGMSGIHCINTWSEMARGIPLKVHPFIDRTLLKANSLPAPKYAHVEYQDPPGLLKREVQGIGNGHANGHRNGDVVANGNGHGVSGAHAANGKSNGSPLENGKNNGGHVDNNRSHGTINGSNVKNGKSNGNHVANGNNVENGKGNGSHVENGKSNGNHVENGKSNGSHVENGKNNGSHVENGKSNGSHVENGKSNGSHVENGKGNGGHVENGKSNGNHVENGKSNGSHVENGKGNGSHVENGKSNGNHVENGKSNAGTHHGLGIGNGVPNGAHYENGNCNGEQIDTFSKPTYGESCDNVKEEDIPMEVGVFKFTGQQLQTLKRMSVEGKTDGSFSSYEMLSGHIWKCVTQARNLDPSQPTKLFIATDGRSRLVPPLPKGYFGNVIFTCTPIATAGELVANPVVFAAGKIHDALARMDDDYLRSALDYLEVQEDVSKLVRGARHFNSPNLGITSWARMPVYECDFGWGRPIFMGPCAIAYEGLAYVLASPVCDGSLSLSLGLRADHMAAFAKIVTDI